MGEWDVKQMQNVQDYYHLMICHLFIPVNGGYGSNQIVCPAQVHFRPQLRAILLAARPHQLRIHQDRTRESIYNPEVIFRPSALFKEKVSHSSNFLDRFFLSSQNLWGNRVPGEQDQRRDDRILRNKKKAVKVLMFVVVIFTVCWLPLQTYQVLSVIAPQVNK